VAVLVVGGLVVVVMVGVAGAAACRGRLPHTFHRSHLRDPRRSAQYAAQISYL